MNIYEMSLFDVEDVEQTPKVRDMVIKPVATSDVQEFARRYHYTKVGNNLNWRWGLWHGAVLHGVVSYNLPTRRTCASIFGSEHGVDKVWHMGRLIVSDRSPRNSESRLISGSLHAIERDHPNIWAIVTYADAGLGHIGTVYQATNAFYTGIGGDPWFYIDAAQQRRGTHFDGHRVSPERAMSMGWTRHYGGIKHRYVYILGNKTQRRRRRALLRLPVLPYPKKDAAT